MTDQSTNGDTDQGTRAQADLILTQARNDLILYANLPERPIEVAKNKRRRLLQFAWLILEVIATVAGTLLLQRYLPTPIAWLFCGLWWVSTFAAGMSGFNSLRYGTTQTDHDWQDQIDRMSIAITEGLRTNVNRALRENDEWRSTYDQIVTSAPAEIQARRGRGRPEVTPAEALGWIDQADRAAADLWGRTGQRPTRDAIAAAIGLSTSTLGRYEKAAGRKVSVNK